MRDYGWQGGSSREVAGVSVYLYAHPRGGWMARIHRADGCAADVSRATWKTARGARKAAERAMRAEVAYESIRLEVQLKEALAWLR